MPPLLLLTLFEDLKPDTPIFYSASGGSAGAVPDAAAGRLQKAADVALGVKATVQVGVSIAFVGGSCVLGRGAAGFVCCLKHFGLCHCCVEGQARDWQGKAGRGQAGREASRLPWGLGGCKQLLLLLCTQADRALWDARAAMLLLLMGRCTQDDAAMEVRTHAVYVLRRLICYPQ